MIDLGMALCSQARYAEAVTAFERADALEFSSIDARDESVNYAICLLRAGRATQSLAMMKDKLRLYPSGALHYHYGLALLTAGQFAEGWDHYEFRWLQEPLCRGGPISSSRSGPGRICAARRFFCAPSRASATSFSSSATRRTSRRWARPSCLRATRSS